ncbi:hypothetical protein [Paenibacillus sp. RC67]|uniref:hypothetical protein n=1 Tax=Paenibacillus sp. RC67 TaxID=3039392 RepID=UPI0024AC9453|nr:hypothetical protein [Paenibacillus sp. RC67]
MSDCVWKASKCPPKRIYTAYVATKNSWWKGITADEFGVASTRQGRLLALKDNQYKQEFGADLVSLKGKNMQGIVLSESAANPPYSDYNNAVITLIDTAMNQMIKQQTGGNTTLRQLQEKANQIIVGLK